MIFIDDVISSFLKLSTGADLNQIKLKSNQFTILGKKTKLNLVIIVDRIPLFKTC